MAVNDQGVVEDDEDDVFIIRRALTKARASHVVHVARDGVEARAYLEGEGHYADREQYPLPILVLLDLQMPRLDGIEVCADSFNESLELETPAVQFRSGSSYNEVVSAAAE